MASPERGVRTTPDGHHLVIDGRRWRATDPVLPEELLAPLRSELGRARSRIRVTRDEEQAAALRGRVQLAKEGLGERGQPWWEMTESERLRRAMEALEKLEGPGDRGDQDRAADQR